MEKTGRNELCPCGSGRKYKKCHGSNVSDAEVVKAIQIGGFHLSQDFKDRNQLVRIGPVIKAEWRVPQEIEQQLKARGLEVPLPVKGYMLIDTGSADIAIDGGVAKELGLARVGEMEVHGIGGEAFHATYKALLLLYLGDVHGTNVAIGMERDFVAFLNLRENHDAYGLKTPEGSPLRIIGIVGRTFLQFTKLTYNGLDGSWSMRVDESVTRPYNPNAPT